MRVSFIYYCNTKKGPCQHNLFSNFFKTLRYEHTLDDERFGSYDLFNLKRLRDLRAVSD
jgi:hypothetical protein